jgi:hypothetical protein
VLIATTARVFFTFATGVFVGGRERVAADKAPVQVSDAQ